MRLIDAEALLELFDKECARECDNCVYYEKCIGHQYCGLIDNAPTIEERPKGKWIIHNDYNENCRYGCDQCGNLTNRNSSFCPDCGVRMER